MDEIQSPEQQRQARRACKSIGKTISDVQPGNVSAFAVFTERPYRERRVVLGDGNDFRTGESEEAFQPFATGLALSALHPAHKLDPSDSGDQARGGRRYGFGLSKLIRLLEQDCHNGGRVDHHHCHMRVRRIRRSHPERGYRSPAERHTRGPTPPTGPQAGLTAHAAAALARTVPPAPCGLRRSASPQSAMRPHGQSDRSLCPPGSRPRRTPSLYNQSMII